MTGADIGRVDEAVGVRERVLPLLAGYWSFGQFWGVRVIL